MTVTRFDGTELPAGWSAITPALSSVVVANGYCAINAAAGADFDGLSSATAVPEGPRVRTAVSGAFDYAVAFGNAVNSVKNSGVDLMVWNESNLQGLRFAQFVSAIGTRDVGWFGRRKTGTVANITLTAPPSTLWGPRGWMRMSWNGVDTFLFQSSMTGKPGTWHTHATVTDAYVPQFFEIHATATPPDLLARQQRLYAVVDMTGRADDATTEPSATLEQTNVFTADFTQGSMPAEFTGTVNGTATIAHTGGVTTLTTDMDTADSYAWLVGPGGISQDHGLLIRYRIPQPSVQNSFAGIAIRATDASDLPSAIILTDKYRPGIGFLAEINGGGSFGDIQRYLATYPIDPDENFDGTQEFYGFSMNVEDLVSPVDGSTGNWIFLRLEMIDGYFRAKVWYEINAEPDWMYEGENYTQWGDNVSIAWSHNDGTTDLTTSSMEISSVEVYTLAEPASGGFDPILVGSGSINDQIIAGLATQGFGTGSIADRERARLLSKLGFASTIPGYSLYDLYRAASEEPRIF